MPLFGKLIIAAIVVVVYATISFLMDGHIDKNETIFSIIGVIVFVYFYELHDINEHLTKTNDELDDLKRELKQATDYLKDIARNTKKLP